MENLNKIKKVSMLFVIVFSMLILTFCNSQKKEVNNENKKKTIKKKTIEVAEKNPFFEEYNTPFKVPPFDSIKESHYMPAFEKGIEESKKEINTIISNTDAPTFENTVEALEKTGKILGRVRSVFFHYNGSYTNDNLQKIAQKVTPMLSKFGNFVSLNDGLFKRIKAVYLKKDELKLDKQQMKLLDKTYRRFVRNGADLKVETKDKVKKINEEMAKLSLQFRQNLLKETNNFTMYIDKKEDLAGLPETVINAASEAAEKKQQKGKWLFTLHKPSWIPFLQFSLKRELREKLYKGYINRGDNNNEFDNKIIIAKIASLRVKKAKLLGYKSFADYRLEINMSKKPENVYKLLNRLWEPALKIAKNERASLQAMIDKEGGKFKLESWDWWYYSEKLRKEKYALDNNELKPYFEINNVRKGAFYVANKLYGITFNEQKDIPNYHPDAKVFEVKEADGTHLGILYTDYYYRKSKRGGAWCGIFQGYSNIDKEKFPITYNVCNFTTPVGDKPSLLTFDEVSTLFHEFGHALHNLFNKTKYRGIARTSRDFVELPAQIMEHWAAEPEVMKIYAKHYKTGEIIPDELIKKLEKSSHFNQGFITVEYLAASLLDMNYHSLTDETPVDTNKFEKEYLNKIGLIPEIISRYRSTYFAHIIGGYASGYHAYIWAEVLDCDAFEAFKETSLYDQKTAKSFRDNILSSGGMVEEAIMYRNFRGRDAKIEGLLKKRGLLNK